MKAIRKEDGKEIEVQPHRDREYVATESEDEGLGRRIYREQDLIIKEAVDWDAYRRETASRVLASIASRIELYIRENDRCKAAVKDALALTDELIRKLKDGK